MRFVLFIFLNLIFATQLFAQNTATQTSTIDIIEEVITTTTVERKDEINQETKQLISVAGAGLDPLQALFTLPGVSENNDGEPVFRGSASNDNQYYVDLIPVAYLFHLFGNSTIDRKILRQFNLFPSAFPSRYSNSTAGVLDIELREPKQQDVRIGVDASFIISGLFVESGVGENGAFYFSYRRSLLDYFADLLLGDEEVEPTDGIRIQQFPISNDYTGKYVEQINADHKINLVINGAYDKVGVAFDEGSDPVLRDPDLEGEIALELGYDSQGIVWEYAPTEYDLTWTTRLINYYNYIKQTFGRGGQRTNLTANSLIFRSELLKVIDERRKVVIGYDVQRSNNDLDFVAKFSPCSEFTEDERCYDSELPLIELKREIKGVNTSNLFVESHYDFASTYITAGVNYFENTITNQARAELRLKIEHELPQNYLLELRYGDYSQRPGLLETDPLIGNPDLMSPSAKHYNFKVFKQIDSLWSLQTEIYHKRLYGIVTTNDDLEDEELLTEPPYTNDADGISEGVELLLKRELSNNWFGWFAASLNRAKRTNSVTNQTVSFQFERPVMFDLVFNYRPNKKRRWEYSFALNFQSGALYTPVVDIEFAGDTGCNSVEQCLETEGAYFVPVYGDLNSHRYPDFYRLDLKIEYINEDSIGRTTSFFFDILNATNRENVIGYSFSAVEGQTGLAPGFGPNVPVEVEVTFGVIPSIGFQKTF